MNKFTSTATKVAPDDFRLVVREWLADNFPAELSGKEPMQYDAPIVGNPAVDSWTLAMAQTGWGVPAWPKRYGGGGLSTDEITILKEEMQAIGAWNPIAGMGVDLLGPTLLELGSEEQKLEHIPAIARQEVRWCQGFSEPGSGSDLASLSTKAEDKGDHFLVNGQKIWMSGGQYADKCFCLVRTDSSAKQAGISFLLIDMHQPGVEVRPIRIISGEETFCQTFFTDARVPKENLVGELNRGWDVAKRLLQHERGGDYSGSLCAGYFGLDGSPAELAQRTLPQTEEGCIADADLRGRITRHEMHYHAYQIALRAAEAGAVPEIHPFGQGSVFKNRGTAIAQDRAELFIEILGLQGLGCAGSSFTEDEVEIARAWLTSKAPSIFGGTYEIQNNIVAKRVLGLG